MNATERFLLAAKAEAIRLKNEYIGPEHLVLGLLRAHSDELEKCFDECGVSLVDVKTELERWVIPGKSPPFGNPDLPVTPRAKQILDSCEQLCSRLHFDPRPDYLILSILQDQINLPGHVMRNLGMTQEALCLACGLTA